MSHFGRSHPSRAESPTRRSAPFTSVCRGRSLTVRVDSVKVTTSKDGTGGAAVMRRPTLRLASGLGVLISMSVMWSSSVSAATALPRGDNHVYVGYADMYHSLPKNFPSPWLDSPGVTFVGCDSIGGCMYDGGAVRVVNETAAPETVNSITVGVDTCSYTWSTPQVVPSGGQLIVTQADPGPAQGCTGPGTSHVDLSDVGPGSSNYSGVCTPDHLIPYVQVTINGATTGYADINQVLNTGGVDEGDCPRGTNESHQWSLLVGQYVALGDSFSSGEGVPHYFNGTAIAHTNECHRSLRAYPTIVAHARGFHDFQFWACSGAVVANIWGTGGLGSPGVGPIGGIGQWNEPAQLTHVTKRTNYVTLSIGGNDVGFGALAKGCIGEGAYYYAVNSIIAHVNATAVARANAVIAQVNQVIALANNLPLVNIPPLAFVPNVPLQTDPASCLGNLPGMINALANGSTETIYKVGNAVTAPCVPGQCDPAPVGAQTFTFQAPSLTQLYLQIAQQAAPHARIDVMAYPPILNPAGLTHACSINVTAPLSGSASVRVHPFQLLPALNSLPNWLTNQIPTTIARGGSLSHLINVDVPAFTPTAAANLQSAQTQLNSTIQAAVAAAAVTDPDIHFVDPYAQFAAPANGGIGGWYCNGPSTNVLHGPTTVTPFFNEVSVLPSSLSISSVNLSVPAVTSVFGGIDPGSVHPNAPGQKALSCAILGLTVAACRA